MTRFVLTMYLNPGVIPEYLNVRDFGMIDTVWSLLIPGALSAYNMIIMCNAFKGIDSAIYDAAKIDGCGETRTLLSVALPLVYPTIATLGLFYAVGRWNGISDVLYYINSSELFTVQDVYKRQAYARHGTGHARADRSGADRRGMYRSVPGRGRRVL